MNTLDVPSQKTANNNNSRQRTNEHESRINNSVANTKNNYIFKLRNGKPEVQLNVSLDLSGLEVTKLSSKESEMYRGLKLWSRQAKRYVKENKIFTSKIELMKAIRSKTAKDQNHSIKFLEHVADREEHKFEVKKLKRNDEEGYLDENFENVMWNKIKTRWTVHTETKEQLRHKLDKKYDMTLLNKEIKQISIFCL